MYVLVANLNENTSGFGKQVASGRKAITKVRKI